MSYSTSSLIKAINHPALADKVMGPTQAQGFTFAIVSAPALIPTKDWWPMLFVDQKISAEIAPEARDAFLQEIMVYFKHAVDELKAPEGFTFPDVCDCKDNNANVELMAFCAGFLQGYHWLSDLWQDRLSNLDDESKSLVSQTLLGSMVLSGHPQLPAMLKDTPKDQLPVVDDVYADMPKTLTIFATFGRRIAAAETIAELKKAEAPKA
ncbi:YecA family protein [Motilimonas cestriensis]|uniref:YecA family protein n=1 Tax=Motilimonas cestriensis TaxID=2742685 RepID=A0ABS8WEJ0_9GAMM|nr:YecA family protein [Motilimonas cestriensis]MCE2596547.1 YecA family protein [Motilimonas cestriensis]